LHSDADKLRPPVYDAFCERTPQFNGFYGHSIVDALRAAQGSDDGGNDQANNGN
jgi:hypothetical protein